MLGKDCKEKSKRGTKVARCNMRATVCLLMRVYGIATSGATRTVLRDSNVGNNILKDCNVPIPIPGTSAKGTINMHSKAHGKMKNDLQTIYWSGRGACSPFPTARAYARAIGRVQQCYPATSKLILAPT